MKNLKTTLLANAIFSGISGLTLLFGAGIVARFMGLLSAFPLQLVGLGLLIFSTYLFWVALRSGMPIKVIRFVILQDWIWVAGSVLLIVAQAFNLTNAGYWIVGIIALIVADFAVLQMRFLSKAHN